MSGCRVWERWILSHLLLPGCLLPPPLPGKPTWQGTRKDRTGENPRHTLSDLRSGEELSCHIGWSPSVPLSCFSSVLCPQGSKQSQAEPVSSGQVWQTCSLFLVPWK